MTDHLKIAKVILLSEDISQLGLHKHSTITYSEILDERERVLYVLNSFANFSTAYSRCTTTPL